LGLQTTDSGLSRRGAPWSTQEEEAMLELVSKGYHREEIAEVLQRTTYAVYCRQMKLGLSVLCDNVDNANLIVSRIGLTKEELQREIKRALFNHKIS
jgi:hypothetical protein